MLEVRRRMAAAGIAAALGLGTLAPAALATYDCPPTKPSKVIKKKPKTKKAKCNAGNGNGSESIVNTGHCTNGDPGNSYAAGNRGGDEVPTRDGKPNPGGNNVP
jgi:hypothetical protein